ncbi:family 1 glycosylhydrolase [Marisediminicola senii]|uniref:family 1 glycosylhydrolase n=1 Tax=Marisediminicola senii TaxID=2711233 RepID=UPI0013EB4F46|nr:family 1 glycosylhydrolase [Marisediminicola senii]
MKWFETGRLNFALGIEDTFVPQSRAGERPIDEYALTQHYEQVHGDLGLVKKVGADLLRWGVPWYRIAPSPGIWDWGWVDRAMDRFRELELTPIIDLLHYGTPLWLDDQFANGDYPQHIADFAHRFAERYGDVATDYTPVNEPIIHALFSGEYAYWPPYLEGATGFATIASSLAQGFVLSQKAIAEMLGDRATFVHVDAGMRFVGDVDVPEHRETVARLRHQTFLVEDLVTGSVRDGHPLLPQLRAGGVTDDTLAWFADNTVRPDVMGVNYYPLHSTEVFEAGIHHRGGFADPRPAVNAGTEGLREVLTTYAERYGAPVMLTETCVTGSVEQRLAWMDDSVRTLHQLRSEGVPVVGFTWWPLFDMYEWTYRHSTNPKADHLLTMGLFDLVDSPSGHLDRRRNPVADRFLEHAAAPSRAGATADPAVSTRK